MGNRFAWTFAKYNKNKYFLKLGNNGNKDFS